MKRHILLLLAVVICICTSAQDRNAERHQPGRTEFNPELYTKRMNEFVAREAHLTPAEAEKFFPLLNAMQQKQREIGRQQRTMMMKSWTTPNMSENDYEQLVMRMTSLEIESKKIEQTYYKKFNNVLSWKKIHGVRIALARFQMEALNQFKPARNNRWKEPRKN